MQMCVCFYFSENNECDFVIQRGDSVSELIQVCWELNATNTEREVGGLLAAVGTTNCKKCKIVTYNQGETLYYGDVAIEVVSAWKLM